MSKEEEKKENGQSAKTGHKNKSTKEDEPIVKAKPVCGIVMPISEIDGCSSEHWVEVREIFYSCIEDAGFEGRLVSHSDISGVIQKRIVQNLYNDDIVICDVSCNNPNVMFELGMRLAFDKPTIIIKDDETDFLFDTGVVEHIDYPRGLRFSRINSFKEELTRKLVATHKAGADAHSYLQSFGEFKIAKIESQNLSESDFIVKSLSEIKGELIDVRRDMELNRINKSVSNDLRHFSETFSNSVSSKDSNSNLRRKKIINGSVYEEKLYAIRSVIDEIGRVNSPVSLQTFEKIRRILKSKYGDSMNFGDSGDLLQMIHFVLDNNK